MSNFKMIVNGKDELIDAQKNFFDIGYMIGAVSIDSFPVALVAHDVGHGKVTTTAVCFNHERHKDYNMISCEQLRNLVAEKKNEQGLISGADALRALADGKEVECRAYEKNWINAGNYNHCLGLFFDESFEFRLKPRTITINGIEVPACGVDYKPHTFMFVLNSLESCEYSKIILDESDEIPPYWWSTEEQIKQVVAALRSVFKCQ